MSDGPSGSDTIEKEHPRIQTRSGEQGDPGRDPGDLLPGAVGHELPTLGVLRPLRRCAGGDQEEERRVLAFRRGTATGPHRHRVSNDSVYRERQVGLAKGIFKLMGIGREDRVERMQWMERGFRYFDAPAAIVIVVDRALSESGPLADIGSLMQNICLAALHYGLGTCIEDQGVMYSGVLRELAGIPDSKRIIMSIAIGYPDPDFPANALETEREPAENVTTWLGFE